MILLFGKNPQKFHPGAYLKIGKFLTETEIQTTDMVEGNLFQQLENTLEILQTKYLVSNIKFEGIHRRIRQGDVSFVLFEQIGKMYQVNNSVIFSEKPIESEEFLNQKVGALGIIIDRCPKGILRK